jgi:hypothetical protein
MLQVCCAGAAKAAGAPGGSCTAKAATRFHPPARHRATLSSSTTTRAARGPGHHQGPRAADERADFDMLYGEYKESEQAKAVMLAGAKDTPRGFLHSTMQSVLKVRL